MLYSSPCPPACVNQAMPVVATLRPRKEVPWMLRLTNPGIPPVRKLLHSSPAPCGLHQSAQSVCIQCSLSRGYHYQHSFFPHWPHIIGCEYKEVCWRRKRDSSNDPLDFFPLPQHNHNVSSSSPTLHFAGTVQPEYVSYDTTWKAAAPGCPQYAMLSSTPALSSLPVAAPSCAFMSSTGKTNLKTLTALISIKPTVNNVMICNGLTQNNLSLATKASCCPCVFHEGTGLYRKRRYSSTCS
jgi:hypothetical protein